MSSRDSEAVTVCGRAFSMEDLETIRGIIAGGSAPTRSAIARQTCETLGWRTPAGRLKEMSCRVALLRLSERNLLSLPAPVRGNGNGKRFRPTQEIEIPQGNIAARITELSGVTVRALDSRADSRQWNEAIGRFHYLGYNALPGAQQRYLIEHDGGLLGAIGFGASAWKVASRDQWIGWTPALRKTRLHLVLNNARFLLLHPTLVVTPERVPLGVIDAHAWVRDVDDHGNKKPKGRDVSEKESRKWLHSLEAAERLAQEVDENTQVIAVFDREGVLGKLLPQAPSVKAIQRALADVGRFAESNHGEIEKAMRRDHERIRRAKACPAKRKAANPTFIVFEEHARLTPGPPRLHEPELPIT